jgi:hypothetical protein
MQVSPRAGFLRNAQTFAQVYGDENWFCQTYTAAREFEGVEDSAERALRSQGLWNSFLQTFYPHRVQTAQV